MRLRALFIAIAVSAGLLAPLGATAAGAPQSAPVKRAKKVKKPKKIKRTKPKFKAPKRTTERRAQKTI